jgi:hypothetical protein
LGHYFLLEGSKDVISNLKSKCKLSRCSLKYLFLLKGRLLEQPAKKFF